MKILLLLFFVALNGCSQVVDINQSNQLPSMLEKDLENLYQSHDAEEIHLGLADVIQIALDHNLDVLVAEKQIYGEMDKSLLEKLNALPDIKAQRDFLKRSNDGASSSQSAFTGNQSLEASFSAERSRRTDLLEANWDVLDSAITIYKSSSSSDRIKIAEQRYKKIKQSLITDVVTSFNRAYLAQLMEPSIGKAIAKFNGFLKSLDEVQQRGDMSLEQIQAAKQQIFSQRSELMSLLENFKLAQIELKALLSIHQDQNIVLKASPSWGKPAGISYEMRSNSSFVSYALNNRPEVIEEFYNKKIAQRDLLNSVLNVFPGFSVLAAFNKDDNSFLDDDDWFNFSASVSQSITRLLTFPFEYQRIKNQQNLSDQKRYALLAAVIAQVHISRTLFDEKSKKFNRLYDEFGYRTEKYDYSQGSKDVGTISGFKLLSEEVEYLVSRYNLYVSYSDAQQSFANLLNTSGYNEEKFKSLLAGSR